MSTSHLPHSYPKTSISIPAPCLGWLIRQRLQHFRIPQHISCLPDSVVLAFISLLLDSCLNTPVSVASFEIIQLGRCLDFLLEFWTMTQLSRFWLCLFLQFQHLLSPLISPFLSHQHYQREDFLPEPQTLQNSCLPFSSTRSHEIKNPLP